MKFKKKNKIYVKKDAGNVPYNNEVFNNSTSDCSEAILNEYKDEYVSIANKTSRTSGASALNKDGSIRSVVGRYVLSNVDKDASILDFGAGKDAVQTQALLANGFKNVTAYDFGSNIKDGVHDPNALSKTYDVVFASNVLNVSSDEEMLAETISEIWSACKNGGKVIVNYPSSPRKAGLNASEVETIIKNVTGQTPKIVASSKSAPVWELVKGNKGMNEAINIQSYEELSSTLHDGGKIYKLFRKLENGKGKWAAAPIVMGDVKYDDAFEITYGQARGYEPISNIGKLSRQLGKKLLPKNEALNEKLVDAPQDVIDELLNILNKYGFVLDDSINHENPIKTFMGDIHIQVINPDSYIDTTIDDSMIEQLQKYATKQLLNEIHDLEKASDCPITWSFGVNSDDKVTAGLDVMKQYVPDENELEEDVNFRDEVPYDYDEMEIELKAATNNWTKDKFECWVKYRSEWFDSRDILSQHYETVEDFGFDEGLYGLYATRPSIYESIDDLNEAVSSKDIMNKLKLAVDDVVDFYTVMGYPYPDGWLGNSWQDINDGLKMGIDNYVELADNLLELLKNEIKSIEKINGLKDEDPDYDTFIELRDNLKYYYNEYLKLEGYTDLVEDTVKQGNYWVNKGKEGTHGKFKTKKAADAQRRAMFAQGYKENLDIITEDKDDEYIEAVRQADYEANQLRDEFEKGDKSIADILIEMEYEQDDPDSVYFYKEVDGGNAIVFDTSKYDLGENYINYFVVDENDKIKQGFTVTKLIIDESLNESNNSYSYENYYIIDFGNCWVAKDSNNRIVCKRETSDEVENWIDEQSNFDEALTTENLSFKCPHCGNNELRCIEHEVNIPADVDFHEIFICDECGSEYLSEPQYDGKIKFKTYYESDL